MDIQKLVELPEGRTLEFKRDLSSMKPILKTLIAFANTAGGTLLIGKEDRGGIIGVKDVFALEEKLSNAIADAIYPPLFPDIDVITVQGMQLLVVRVAHWRGPFYLKAMGPKTGVFIRLGSTNRAADQEMLEELIRSHTNMTYDQLPIPEVGIEGLDREQIERVFAKIDKRINERKLESMGLLVPYNGNLVCSNGGILLFGKEELKNHYFPNSIVRCARFEGKTKIDFLDQLDIEGSIVEVLDVALRFIKRNTRQAAKIREIRRKEIPEYLPEVIREVLINALVHANYALNGMHIRLMIYSDRLEIESPGMFPFGHTLEDFHAGVSHVRNKVIARVFRELNLLEEWGTGYRRICDISGKKGYQIPTWVELGSCIRVTIPPYSDTWAAQQQFGQDRSHFSERQERILLILKQNESLSTKELFAQLDEKIAERTLRGDLALLKKYKRIIAIGKGPSTKWKICSD